MDRTKLIKGLLSFTWDRDYKSRFEKNDLRPGAFLTAHEMDPDLEWFFGNPKLAGQSVLDVGAGTGEQAIFLAKKGFRVTATDVSLAAINFAEELAAAQSVAVDFIHDNILFTTLKTQFDIIVDRGCFAILPEEADSEYLSIIDSLLKPGGRFVMKIDNRKTLKLDRIHENGLLNIRASFQTFYETVDGDKIAAVFFILRKELPGS